MRCSFHYSLEIISASSVSGVNVPVDGRPRLFWNRLSAARMFGPTIPSIAPLSLRQQCDLNAAHDRREAFAPTAQRWQPVIAAGRRSVAETAVAVVLQIGRSRIRFGDTVRVSGGAVRLRRSPRSALTDRSLAAARSWSTRSRV